MAGEGLFGTLRGTIVADETFYGGMLKNRHVMERTIGRTEAKTDKIPIMTLIDADTREVRSRVVPDVTGATLAKVITQHVDKRARFSTPTSLSPTRQSESTSRRTGRSTTVSGSTSVAESARTRLISSLAS